MPTPVERIARLEEQILGVREDVQRLVQELGDNRTPGSVRYRLHQLEGLQMIHAGVARLAGRGWKFVAGVCLLLVTAAPYVLFFASR